MIVGACYYPEHWSEERWETDADLMQKAGFNAVRMGEFAWTKLEPEEGVFDFGWLDRCMALLGSRGIRTILGTPTASPPKWIMDRHPDAYKRDAQGQIRGFGTRMHYCFNHAGYHGYVSRLVGALAAHYKDHPHLIGWQIDNEFGCVDTAMCYCDNCRASFQTWLREKYGTVEALNETWGTVVWNNTYRSFDEVIVPRQSTYNLHNPGLLLDYRRFSTDCIVKFQDIQIRLLRSAAPQLPITHNMMGTFGDIDYYKLAADLDVAGLDVYPNFPDGEPINPYTPALHHDITRGIKGQRNYWILEHQSGTPGGAALLPTPRPGDLRRWTYQSVAHGADALLYFRWRTAVFGGEEFWHGILHHSGRPGRLYAEAACTGSELAELADKLDGSTVRNDAAIVRCYENGWAFEFQPLAAGYRYLDRLKAYHRYFIERGTGVDIVAPDADWSAYKVVILPGFTLVGDRMAERVADYVRAGGVALIDWRAGAKLPDNRMRPEVLPGPFRAVAGIEIGDYGIIAPEASLRIRFTAEAGATLADRDFGASVWYDVAEPKGAVPLAAFESDYFAGAPAVTRNRYGKGLCYYVATVPEQEALFAVLDEAVAASGAEARWTVAHPEVEVAYREKGGERLAFIINHAREPVAVTPPAGSVDLLAGKPAASALKLAAGDVLVLSMSIRSEH